MNFLKRTLQDFTLTKTSYAGLREVKAQLLCEGFNADEEAIKLFQQQNPSNVKRGGLSSGGKMKLGGWLPVNAPLYQKRRTNLQVVKHRLSDYGVTICQNKTNLCRAEILPAPKWYDQKVGQFDITRIITAHNQQLAAAVYEDCCLFAKGEQCKFCVINQSQSLKHPDLMIKSGNLIVEALEKIPRKAYKGLTLNGGMTRHPGRGLELIVPIVEVVRRKYPKLPIAVEMTPPADLTWIDKLAQVGVSSLMMNLEFWDQKTREELIPGKAQLCPKELYISAFKRAVEKIGRGRVTTCFVVGVEPTSKLKEGIIEVIKQGVIPSPLAGRYFEDIPNYPFRPSIAWCEFLSLVEFAAEQLRKQKILSTDRAGCVACGMCDLIKDFDPNKEWACSYPGLGH